MKLEYFYVGQDIQIQISDSFKDELVKSNFIGDLFDELGDIVTADEINPNSGEHWLAHEDNLFSLDISDFNQLKEKGFCKIYYIGSIEDSVDLGLESDRNFYNWYYNILTNL